MKPLRRKRYKKQDKVPWVLVGKNMPTFNSTKQPKTGRKHNVSQLFNLVIIAKQLHHLRR